GIFSFGQALENQRIRKNKPGLMESSNEILRNAMVHAGFAADAGIDLGKQRGWYLHHRYTAHVYRRNETRHISNNTAANGDNCGLTRQLQVHHLVQQSRHRCERFRPFAVWNESHWKFLL